MNAAAQPQQPQPTLAERLSKVRVGLRQDLDVSRHLFRGEPAYVIRDPVTFQSHRFEPNDYDVVVSIDASRSLGDVFEGLVEQGTLAADDEERFYQFIFQLHRLGFLNLPVSDDKLLYRRHRARQKAKAKARIVGILFMQVPLWDPDAFLTRTMRFAKPVFSRGFFLIWLALALCALTVGIFRAHDLVQPINGLLATRNLFAMWFTLIILKVFHEFGHAYACKILGGHVPEMGAYFIAFTPCAYVDATGSWSFTRKRDRLIVCVAGMYVEMFFASIATFVWALTGPSMLNSLAYNVMFLASVTTILFNINPLMRFDGYYIFSDITEIPNLRARATAYVQDHLKRHVLGVKLQRPPMSLGLRATLLGYGIAATMYRTLVLVGIAATVATKFLAVGIGLAVFFLGNTVISLIRRLYGYLWYAEETAPVRRRAVAVGTVILAGVPTAILFVPVRTHVLSTGLIEGEHETVVRAEASAFLEQSHVEAGRTVHAGQPLVRLENDSLKEALLTAEAELEVAQIQRDAYRVDDPATARQQDERVQSSQLEVDRRAEQLASLEIDAPIAGKVVQCLDTKSTGVFVQAGQPVATIITGGWRVRVQLTEQEISLCRPKIGDPVEFRSKALPGRTFTGKVERVKPAGSRKVGLAALTQVGGGDIVVEPDGRARQPYFDVTIAMGPDSADALQHGLTGQVRFQAQAESIGLFTYRRIARFINKLSQG